MPPLCVLTERQRKHTTSDDATACTLVAPTATLTVYEPFVSDMHVEEEHRQRRAHGDKQRRREHDATEHWRHFGEHAET